MGAGREGGAGGGGGGCESACAGGGWTQQVGAPACVSLFLIPRPPHPPPCNADSAGGGGGRFLTGGTLCWQVQRVGGASGIIVPAKKRPLRRHEEYCTVHYVSHVQTAISVWSGHPTFTIHFLSAQHPLGTSFPRISLSGLPSMFLSMHTISMGLASGTRLPTVKHSSNEIVWQKEWQRKSGIIGLAISWALQWTKEVQCIFDYAWLDYMTPVT